MWLRQCRRTDAARTSFDALTAGDADLEGRPELRLVEVRFLQIQQAVGTTRDRRPDTVAFLHETVEDLNASGFVSDALIRSGQAGAAVAPPA